RQYLHQRTSRSVVGFLMILFICMHCRLTNVNAQTTADPLYYSFSPASTWTVGSGFLHNDPTRIMARCIDSGDPVLVDATSGPFYHEYEAKVVTDSNSLFLSAGFDLKMEASALFADGSYELHVSGSKTDNSNAVAIVLTSKSEFSRRGMNNPKLTEYAKN